MAARPPADLPTTGGKAAGGSALGEAQAASNYARSRAALQAAEAGPAAAKAGAGGRLAAAVSTAAPVLGGVLAGVAAFVAASLILSTLLGAIAGFWQDEQDRAMIEGLPGFIAYDMVLEALECQEEYGHPAGCTIAQIICESGQGDAMSQLATRDHNLFGIKWASSFASCPEVAGKASWATHEEVDGQAVTVMADFTVFQSDADCIRFRSRVLLQNSRYADNALIKEAIADRDSDKMAEGLKDAGYATSSEYVESLKSVMRTYNLYRFDGMGVDDFEKGAAGGDAIVQAAYSQLGVPYVWGGSTPGVGLDCSGLTQYCYRQAGISISHYTEDQLKELTVVPLSQARPGDILYKYGHVAIYVGGDEYIHEPRTGDVCRKATESRSSPAPSDTPDKEISKWRRRRRHWPPSRRARWPSGSRCRSRAAPCARRRRISRPYRRRRPSRRPLKARAPRRPRRSRPTSSPAPRAGRATRARCRCPRAWSSRRARTARSTC